MSVSVPVCFDTRILSHYLVRQLVYTHHTEHRRVALVKVVFCSTITKVKEVAALALYTFFAYLYTINRTFHKIWTKYNYMSIYPKNLDLHLPSR